MKDYYQILGVSRDASESEIKRSYFKLVRTCSPEEEPEKFKEIREAYEYLREEKNRQDEPEAIPDDPWARRLLEQIKKCMEYRNYWKGADTAQEAFRAFPKESIFLYYLVFCERKAGYTGKAVKNCEFLLEKEPGNLRYEREMALAYAARGYRKKALESFGKTYGRGCRDLEFILEYSVCCEENKQYMLGRDILIQAVGQEGKLSKSDVGKLIDVYYGIIELDGRCRKQVDRLKLVRSLSDFICRYAQWMEEYSDDLDQLLYAWAKGCADVWKEAQESFQRAIDALEDVYDSEESKEALEDAKRFLEGLTVLGDERFGDAIKKSWDFYSYFEKDDTWDESEKSYIGKYAELDCQLCMLDEMPGILEEFELLKEVSPEYYGKLSGFIQTLKGSANLTYLKNKLLKEYRRMSAYMSGGRYFEIHPEEKQSGATVWNDEDPFVRKEKKIGRNDPCPCGSGKKYKKCCGRNGG